MDGVTGSAAGLLTMPTLPCRRETLQDVSFTVMPGQTLALVRLGPDSLSFPTPVLMEVCGPGCGVRILSRQATGLNVAASVDTGGFLESKALKSQLA